MEVDAEVKEKENGTTKDSVEVMSNGDTGTRTDDEEEEDEEDEEPRLKYVSLTKNQAVVYRNGDANSAFTVAGDKMV